MKSSRSASTRNTRRNARKLNPEPDESESDASDIDSAQAEKSFSRRRRQKYSSNLDNTKGPIQAETSLFRVSDTSDLESSLELVK